MESRYSKVMLALVRRLRSLVLPTAAVLFSVAGAVGQKAPARISVSGSGFQVMPLNSGAVAFANRNYVWQPLPAQLEGWQITQVSGGVAAKINVVPQADGDLYVASVNPPQGSEWQSVAGLSLTYNDKFHTSLRVYREHVAAQTTVAIPQSGWAGTLVIAPEISETNRSGSRPTSLPPGVVIDYQPPDTRRFVGSPSLVILPDGTYVASHDIFGPGANGDVTLIFQSTDRGRTWTKVAQVSPQNWSSLFFDNGSLYLLGPDHEFGRIIIRRSTDEGRTWTQPTSQATGILLPDKGMHCAPTPVIAAHGRIWRAFEWNPPDAGHGRHFRAFLLSALEGADLLRADSWSATTPLPYDTAETGGNWLEGNAVIAPDGSIDDILRIDKAGQEKAARLHLSSDGSALTWNPAEDRIDFPGGAVKFTIRFDPKSQLYWSLVDKQRDPDARRNVLALTSSPDLIHWTVQTTLLKHEDPDKHAFQYVDWQFDGNDIVAVSRTSWDGDTYHNANYLTFHRLLNFRSASRSMDQSSGPPPSELAVSSVAGEESDDTGSANAQSTVPESNAFRSEFLFTTAPFPSCHASTIVETSQHTLLAAWFGGKREGTDDVKIWVSRYEHGGWTPPAMAATGVDESGLPAACYNPVLFQPKSAPLLLFYKVGHKPAAWRGYVSKSADDGRTWSPGRLLPTGYFGPDKDKPMQLADGTILCGSSGEADGWQVHFEFTDPNASQWRKTRTLNDPSIVGAIQPTMLPLGGNRILAIGRTDQGHVFSMTSGDAGQTWSPMRLLDLPNPNAGIDAIRLTDGRFLLVYNPSTKSRRPISIALSDDGEHWRRVLDMETGASQYSYPAVIQSSDGIVHIVYTWRRKRIRHVVLDPRMIQ